MSYPDFELNESTTEMNILKMLEVIYEKMNSKNASNKLFYIKLPFGKSNSFLNYDTNNDEYFFSTKEEPDGLQTKFTQEEIDILKEDIKFSCFDLEKCKVPVEEEE